LKEFLDQVVENLDMDPNDEEALLGALWENFETFEILRVREEDNTMITGVKQRIFDKQKFAQSYLTGAMEIEDLTGLLF